MDKSEHRKKVLEAWQNHKSWIEYICPRAFYSRPHDCGMIFFPRMNNAHDNEVKVKCPSCDNEMLKVDDVFFI